MYPFDPALNAAATLKERFVWALFMGALFFILYGGANQFAALHAPHPSIVMEWERELPFVPWFIIPYMSSDVMFVIAFMLPQSRLELRTLALRVLFIMGVASAVFVLYPLQFGFSKPSSESYRWLFDLLKADLPYNQLPSLHIAFAIVLWASMRRTLRLPLLKYAVAAWLWLIALSTLLVYQHHFIDLPTGALLGAAAVGLIRSGNPMLERFTTPRSLKMGLYYLFGSVLFLVAAFAYHSLLPFWLFLTLGTVAVAYAFGFGGLLSDQGRANVWRWALFAPYYLGNHLSWRWYKRRIPLSVRLEEGVHFGRLPAWEEYENLRSLGVSRAINLCSEHPLHQSPLPQERLPLFDQTIPSPESLHRAVMLIEKHRDEGVYVHCALGLSRSVMAVSAWMHYRGYTPEQITQQLDRLRPGYVKKAYVRIALELYRNYLERLPAQEDFSR